ncbi:MAG: TonB-dependent receptor [Acidobacteriota bacterium]
MSVAIFCVLICVGHAFAQSTVTGGINGKVTDPQGAVVPNAKVTATNRGTNSTVTVQTNSDGEYRLLNLQPGKYSVEVSGSGFAPAKADNITVEVSTTTSIDIPLTVGTAVAEVKVTSDAPVINTSDNSAGLNINQTSINELPINGRRASSFVLASPGVVPDGGFGLYSFRGISGLLNNSTVDGGDDTQAFFSEARGRTRISYSISLDAVREFSVSTSNYSAEYGRAAGGVVNTITKSGTNNFHGSAFYYLRDAAWAARNPLSFQSVLVGGVNRTVALKPADKRHQFGGSLGGPIVKDRLFFFMSYDEQRRNFPGVAAPSSTTFLTPLIVPTGTCPTSSPDPRRPDLLCVRGITQAQADAGMSYIRSLTGFVARKGNQRILTPKLDWVINKSNTLSAVYNRMRWNSPAGVQTAAVVNNGITSWGNDKVTLDSLNVRLNSTFGGSMINEARFQWSRDLEQQFGQAPVAGEPVGPSGFPPSVFTGTGGITLGKPNFLDRAAYPNEKRIQFADSFTWTLGRHSLKFGGDFNNVSDVLDNLFQNAGVYSYSTLADFLTDFSVPSQKRYSSYNQGFGPSAFSFKTQDYNAFVQDNFQITPRLMLNLGLRYEYEKLPAPQIPNPLVPRSGIFPHDHNNFGPRIGFAYDVFGDGKTSLRGGYGIYYGRIINSTISNAITNTAAVGSQVQYSLTPANAGSPIYPNVLTAAPSASGAKPDIVVFAGNMQMPLIHQADVIIERQLGSNTVVSFSAMFSRGRDLPTFVDTNLPAPAGTTTYTFNGGQFAGQTVTVPKYSGLRPNTNFGRITEIQSTIHSSYQGYVVQLNRRMTNGLQFQTSYTYSRARDNNQGSVTFSTPNVPLDVNNLALDEGVSNFDVPHRFVASLVYAPRTLFSLGGGSKVGRAILGGWSIAPIVVGASGNPYSYNVSGNVSGGISTGILGAGGANRLTNVARNRLRTPSTWNTDLRISRRFRFTESTNLEILGEAFNLFNRFQVTGVGTTAYSISGTTLNYQTTTFGVPSAAGNSIIRERQIQFSARLSF